MYVCMYQKYMHTNMYESVYMISIYLYALCVHYCGSAMTIAELRQAIGQVIATTPCLQPFLFQLRFAFVNCSQFCFIMLASDRRLLDHVMAVRTLLAGMSSTAGYADAAGRTMAAVPPVPAPTSSTHSWRPSSSPATTASTAASTTPL